VHGSDHEPDQDPARAADPHVAFEQMRDVTTRLRDQAWMVAPMTQGVIQLPDTDAAAAPADGLAPH
jgi:hypothetical protein